MIVPLLNVTLLGRQAQKEGLIQDLQDFGCLEIIPLRHAEAGIAGGASPAARETLRFLQDCPTQRRQVKAEDGFDPAAFEQEVLTVRNRTEELSDRADLLAQQISELRPWGDFRLPVDSELAGYGVWLYAVPHDAAGRVDLSAYTHVLVRKDARFRYVAVVAKQQPDIDLAPVKVPGPPADLREELDRVETDLEDLQVQRARLTKWRDRFASRLDWLDDLAGRQQVATQTMGSDSVFAVRAWCPEAVRDSLTAYATDQGLAVTFAAPRQGDEPPTLLANPPRATAGEGLVNFYMTPGYFTWDPSRLVLVSFAVFFAMIIADAGYAALMAVALLLFWRKMGASESGRRGRAIFTAVTGASVVYGVMVGSYFGLAPAPQSLLGKIGFIDATSSSVMMRITILIGIAHLVYANVRRARIQPTRAEALAPAGWVAILLGAAVVWLGTEMNVRAVTVIGGLSMIIGGLGVVLYTQPRQTLLRRLLSGVIGLTRVTSAFGDVLSYLRLFALGLASASLAVAFNSLAGQAQSHSPRIGLVLAVLILLVGHTLNIVLSLMSGVVHGLRLNVIEFFNWALPEEGRLFRAFRRKETPNGTMGTLTGLDRDLRTGSPGGDRQHSGMHDGGASRRRRHA